MNQGGTNSSFGVHSVKLRETKLRVTKTREGERGCLRGCYQSRRMIASLWNRPLPIVEHFSIHSARCPKRISVLIS
jgi:hypothetical protein